MGSSAAPSTSRPYLLLVLCCLLFAGVGRLASFTLHEPLLAYGNSYDMIRIQACHQIWPADKGVDITTGTPDAPLRRYTLDKTVATPCFPSSELVFTSIGIELAKIRNQLTGEPLVSIRMIAAVKAVVLAATVIGFGLFFLVRRNHYAFCLNALCMLLVLSDPAITLYFGTFYTEFSAVYFLYVLLAGVAVLAMQQYRWQAAWPLLIGIIGLGLSKPQHIPLALFAGTLLGAYLALRPRRVGLAVLVLAAAVLPLLLLLTNHFTPRDKNMVMANKLNAVAAMISASPVKARPYLLKQLGLGEGCLLLEGKNWSSPEVHNQQLCPELGALIHSTLVMRLASHPRLFLSLISAGLPRTRDWVFNLYGHVEGKTHGDVSQYHWTAGKALSRVPGLVWQWLGALQLLLSLVFVLLGVLGRTRLAPALLFLGMVGLMSLVIYVIALLGDGFFDLAKHAHLAIGTSLAFYLSLLAHGIMVLGKQRGES